MHIQHALSDIAGSLKKAVAITQSYRINDSETVLFFNHMSSLCYYTQFPRILGLLFHLQAKGYPHFLKEQLTLDIPVFSI